MSFQKVDPTNDQPSLDPKLLLLYGYTGKELKSLETLFTTYKHNYKLISSEQTGSTIESLITNEETLAPPIEIPPQRTLVISGYSQQELHKLLQILKTLTIQRPIMATVTPTSKKWAFGDLVKELMQEHIEMSKKRPRPNHEPL